MNSAAPNLRVTLGAGKSRPQGSTIDVPVGADGPVEALAKTLRGLPAEVESWWAPYEYDAAYRDGARWLSASGVAVDADYLDDDGAHVAIPDEIADEVLAAAKSGDLPGCLFHPTPRGVRVAFVFTRLVTDPGLRERAVRGAISLIDAAFARLHLAPNGTARGLAVDRVAIDAARFMYAPNAIVGGVARSGDVLVIRHEPIDPDSLAAAAPPETPRPALSASSPREPETTNDFERAVGAFNAAHPLDLPQSSGLCPACGHDGCFGQLKGDPSRWSCFSGNHGKDSGSCGLQGRACWHGDALDLAAHEARLSRSELLRRDGLLGGDSTIAEPADVRPMPTAADPTDCGNAARLVKLHGQDLRHCKAFGWLAWDGKRWRTGAEKAATEHAKATVASILDEAKREGATDRGRDLVAHWRRSGSEGRIAAMLRLAESDPAIAVEPDDFDGAPYLINVRNGTLDLKVGKLREHRRDDLLTKLAAVRFVAGAKSQTLQRFLERIQPDPEIRAFLKRRAGYALTGESPSQGFDVDYGVGANGKSTFAEAFADLLGDYARAIPFHSLVTKRDGSEPTNDLASLQGARLVLASEAPDGAKLNLAMLKRLTGGDRVPVRFLHKEFFSLRPGFKLWIDCNHKPTIDEDTVAAWRRVTLTPWEVVIPTPERDGSMKRRLLAEREGVFSWAIEGCLAVQEGGLAPPAPVLSATTEYQREQDPLSGFLADRCDVGRAFLVTSADLEAAFREWAADNERDPLAMRALAPKLTGKGFRKAKDTGERCWRGLRLRRALDTSDMSTPSLHVSPQEASPETNYPKPPSNVSDVSSTASRESGEEG